MATDNLKEHETEIANAIRGKKGTSALINPQDFAKEIRNLPSGEAMQGRISSFTLNSADYLSTEVPSGYSYALYIFSMTAHDNGYFAVQAPQGIADRIYVGDGLRITLALFILEHGDAYVVGGTDNYTGGFSYVQEFDGIFWSAESSGTVEGSAEYWAFN